MAIRVHAPSIVRSLILATTATGNMTVDSGGGLNRALAVVALQRSGTLRALAVTYNGVSMTNVAARQETSQTIKLEAQIWILANPAPGSNTLTVSAGANTTVEAIAIAFDGALQASTFDSSDSNAWAAVQTMTLTLTPANAGCILVGGSVHEGLNASSNSFGTSMFLTDQGAWNTAGSYSILTGNPSSSLGWQNSENLNAVAAMAAFKPAPSDFSAVASMIRRRGYQHMIVR